MAVLSCSVRVPDAPEPEVENEKGRRSDALFARGSGGLAWVPQPRGESRVGPPLGRCRSDAAVRGQRCKRELFRTVNYLQLHNDLRSCGPSIARQTISAGRRSVGLAVGSKTRGRRRIGPGRATACRGSRRPRSASPWRLRAFRRRRADRRRSGRGPSGTDRRGTSDRAAARRRRAVGAGAARERLRRSTAPGCATGSSRRRRRTRSRAATRASRPWPVDDHAADERALEQISGATSRWSGRPRISAVVIAFGGSPSQRAARQTARISAAVRVRLGLDGSRAAWRAPFPGRTARSRRRAGSGSAAPISTATLPQGSPTQKASISPAAIAAAIRGGGTVHELQTRSPMPPRRASSRRAPRASTAGTARRSAAARRPRRRASARPVAAASSKPPPGRGDVCARARGPRRSCRR